LAVELLRRSELQTERGVKTIDRLVLLDAASELSLPGGKEDDARITWRGGVDLRTDGAFEDAVNQSCSEDDTLSVFHLGGIASGDGEANDEGADLALDINFLGTRRVMTFLRTRDRKLGSKSRLVFTSTNAVFAPSDTITDDAMVMPRTSYGTAKAMCELLINDWSRRGFLDARCTRMPAVVARTTPNASAASAWSDIISQPCSGQTAHISVPKETSLPIISIFHMMDNIVRLHNISDAELGSNRIVVMPALAVRLDDAARTVEEILKQRNMKLPDPVTSFKPDPKVADIVSSWPPYHKVERAFSLGWTVDSSVADIVTGFLNGRDRLP